MEADPDYHEFLAEAQLQGAGGGADGAAAAWPRVHPVWGGPSACWLHLPPCSCHRSDFFLPFVLAGGGGGGGGGDEEFIDDDIAIEGGASQLAPNPRCPITAKAVRRVAVHCCCPPTLPPRQPASTRDACLHLVPATLRL